MSPDGLIITNHHVAFDAVRQMSGAAAEQDYVKRGFVARRRSEEMPAANYQAGITRSCEDVSAAVREAVGDVPDAAERARKVSQASRSIEKAKTAALGGEGSGFWCRVVAMCVPCCAVPCRALPCRTVRA